MAKHQKACYLVERSSGKRIKLGGALPSRKQPPRASKYNAFRFKNSDLPRRVDLRPYLTKVEDQAVVNSCTANAIAGAYEYLAMRALGASGDISRLFIYYNSRQYDGIQGDEGSTITGSIRVLEELGACTEALWVYDPQFVNCQPSAEAYEEALSFLVKEAQEIDINLYAMKHCLAEGYPFAFGLKLFKSFDRAGKHGRVLLPEPNSKDGRTSHSSHAMLCVGYSDKTQAFIVRNSWGESWGDQGYCYIPYAYLANPEYCWDCWAIRTVSDLDFSSGVWVEDDECLYDEEDEDEEYDYEYEYDEYEEDEEEYIEDEQDTEAFYAEEDEEEYIEEEDEDTEAFYAEEDEEEYIEEEDEDTEAFYAEEDEEE